MHRVRKPRRHHEPGGLNEYSDSTIDVRVSQAGVGLLSRVQLQMSVGCRPTSPSSSTFWDGRLCHGGLCQGKHRSYCTEVSGSRRPSTSKSDSVSSWLSRAMFCFIRRKYSVVQRQLYPPRNSFTLRHLLYRRRPVPTKSTSSSSMSSSSPSSCTSVFDRGVIFLSPMEFRSASSERGADESTGRKSRRDGTPTCHQGCSLALSFVEGTVAVLTWCSWFTVRSFFQVWWLLCQSCFERRLEGRRGVS